MLDKFIILLACLLSLVVASPAAAGIKGGEFTISPFYGAYVYDGSQQLEPSFSAGIRLGYNLNKNWGVESQFTWAALKTDDGYGNLYNFSGDLLYHIALPEETVVPYVVVGGGWSKTDFVTGSSGNPMFEYGAGLKYFISEDVALRMDIRQIFSQSPNTGTGAGYWQNSAFNVGMSFQFGRPDAVSPAVAVQQPEPVKPSLDGPSSWQAENTTATPGKILVTGMRVDRNEFEIIATRPIRDYKLFTLSQPSRLVVDIANGESGFKLQKVIINRLGIATVRFESYPDYLRIYFDAAQGRMIPYRVEETDRGLKIIVTEP